MSDHAEANRSYWNAIAPDWVERGQRAWGSDSPYWGVFEIPNAELPVLPGDLTGLAAVELGCGTGYGSAWMARLGASVVGIDISEEQLATAHRLAAEHPELDVTFVHGDAEQVPRPDASFDVALSEYGAAIWCDPEVWLREAHRLLKPGGRLVFLGNHPLCMVAFRPDGGAVERRLHRPYLGMRALDWRGVEVDPGGVEFNRPWGDWLALFRTVGFALDDYREVGTPEGFDATGDSPWMASMAAWGRDYPVEQVFWLTKIPAPR